ncbi:MAG: HAMP domain-containing histidine kinase [bacterium]|nr:HAMP domain-containing histidine kinase [bacterium]
MKRSIRRQLAAVTIGLLVSTILLCLFINNTFLERYYEMEKADVVKEAYLRLNEAAASDSFSSESFQQEMGRFAFVSNINVEVIDINSLVVYAAVFNNGQELSDRLVKYIIGYTINSRFSEELTDDVPVPGTIFKFLDLRTKTEYIEMYGQLDNGYWYIINTTMESIQESVRIANRFLAYIGVASALVGGVLMWLISKRVTDPVLELAAISERMTHLDFDAKYHGQKKNEIGLLGSNINQLSESLETTISELKTANNELQRDIEKKEQIDEMRREFLSNVSHELKTPIALIQGYAEGLKEGVSDDPESREFYCDVIVDEAGKMNVMVQKLLTLNQLEFGNDVISMERFDIVAMIRGYLQSAEILTRPSEISVQMKQTQPIYVWGDEFRIEEVFMNYFTNAVHYCQGEKMIDVRVEPQEGKVRVSVFNTGEPIPEESLAHLWEKFYKVDKARTRQYGGSGVGLSIVKAIMESMNQEYGVQNYSNGVEFWFMLEMA